MSNEKFALTVPELHKRFKSGCLSLDTFIAGQRQIIIDEAGYNAWIYVLSDAELAPYIDALKGKSMDDLPLYGVPFAIKDNIDLAGIPTTAACKAFSFVPKASAFIVQRLIDAGAIPMGKANMDQFATGLVGTRSDFGPAKNAFNPRYISGGSSSGSAVAVARGHVSFSLGTDTAGSGRVPAMLNNLYGLKPSRGLLSMSGVLPACQSLDCPSIFALTAADATSVFNVASQYDDRHGYSRKNTFSNSSRYSGLPSALPRIAIPIVDNLTFFDDAEAEQRYSQVLDLWEKSGAKIHEVDIQPLLDAARMLYEGPWVAERYAELKSTFTERPEIIHPVVKAIVEKGAGFSADEAYVAEYKMQGYRKLATDLLDGFDFLLTPTAPRTYTIDEMLNDPVRLNSHMGYYTNYMNLLDLCGIAVPGGEIADKQQFGTTLIAPAFSDQKLLAYAGLWQVISEQALFGATADSLPVPVSPKVNYSDAINVVVCGAHLSGQPLNWQLIERGGSLVRETKTAALYRFYALAGGPPFRPGLIRDEANGSAIEVEVWSIPRAEFGSFVTGIPHPLGIGKVELSDGSWESGFICEYAGIEGSRDITELGSWRKFLSDAG